MEFVFWLAEAWKLGARKKAGTSSKRGSNRRVGPFVELVRTALGFLDPNNRLAKQDGLGDRVREALNFIEDTLPTEDQVAEARKEENNILIRD